MGNACRRMRAEGGGVEARGVRGTLGIKCTLRAERLALRLALPHPQRPRQVVELVGEPAAQ